MITAGSVASQRASATFCWFPPESCSSGASNDGILVPRRFTNVSVISRSRAKSSNPPREIRRNIARVVLEVTGISRMTPYRRRSSGTYAIPSRTASPGRIDLHRLIAKENLPRVRRRQPKKDSRQFRSPGPHQPRQAEDFPGAHF